MIQTNKVDYIKFSFRQPALLERRDKSIEWKSRTAIVPFWKYLKKKLFHFLDPQFELLFSLVYCLESHRLGSNKEYFHIYSVHHLYEDCHKGQFIIHKLSKKGSRSKLSSFLFKLIFLWGDCWEYESKYCLCIKIKILIIDVQAK